MEESNINRVRDGWELLYHIRPNEDGYIIGESRPPFWAPLGLDIAGRKDFVSGLDMRQSFRSDTGEIYGEWHYEISAKELLAHFVPEHVRNSLGGSDV